MLPLLLCYAQDKFPIQGRTRMQKMIFLFEKKVEMSEYQFQAANFGPFSWRLSSAIDSLVHNGLIHESKSTFEGAEKYEYDITKDGVDMVKEWLAMDTRHERYLEIMSALKREHNGMSLSNLLRRIYSQYPDYAVKSQYEF
jgi:uncharacterized protein YwgA